MKRGFNFDMASIADSSFIGSDKPVTEYGFALKRYLLDTEATFEDNTPSAKSADTPKPSESVSRPRQDNQVHNEEYPDGAESDSSASAEIYQRKNDAIYIPDQMNRSAQLPIPERIQDTFQTAVAVRPKINEDQNSTRAENHASPARRSTPRSVDDLPSFVSKWFLSREVLLRLGYQYIEAGDYVCFTGTLDSSELGKLTMMSMQLCKARKYNG